MHFDSLPGFSQKPDVAKPDTNSAPSLAKMQSRRFVVVICLDVHTTEFEPSSDYTILIQIFPLGNSFGIFPAKTPDQRHSAACSCEQQLLHVNCSNIQSERCTDVRCLSDIDQDDYVDLSGSPNPVM